MATPKRGSRLGSNSAHQKLMMSGMASDLFRHGGIRTTHAKAKFLRPYAEKLITKAKKGDLASRRAVLADLRDRDVVAYLFEDVAPRFADRNGGYTRILKLGPRPGDNAPMALIELVDRGTTVGDEVIEDGKVSRSRGLFGRRRRVAEPVFVYDESDVDEHAGHDHGDHEGHDHDEVAAAPEAEAEVVAEADADVADADVADADATDADAKDADAKDADA